MLWAVLSPRRQNSTASVDRRVMTILRDVRTILRTGLPRGEVISEGDYDAENDQHHSQRTAGTPHAV